jgi:hypothetical protein
MRNRMRYILTLVFITSITIAKTQNEIDVLRYSTTDIFGSARVSAMAGSFGALGADISSALINPAGLGRYSKSDFAVSFSSSSNSTTGIYNGTTVSEKSNRLHLNNIGFVFTNDLSKTNSGRKYGQFTIAYNRLQNFNSVKRYEGQNFYSLLDVFGNIGQGISPETIYDQRPFTTGLAYDVFALDYDQATGSYISRLTLGDNYHNRQINTEGGMGEFSIGYSENYMNKLYYGFNVGIRTINYNEDYVHEETLLEPDETTLRSFEYRYGLNTGGTGFNLKLGLLYLPTNNIRLGLAYESPTIFNLSDSWTANMTATHDYGVESINPIDVPEGEFDYRMITPMKVRGSFAYIINLRGAINVDFEVARFGQGSLRPSSSNNLFNPYDFSFENAEVSNQYRTVLNTRVGAEYMILRDIYLRGGLALLPQPFKRDLNSNLSMNYILSGGIGYETDLIRVDLALRHLSLDSNYFSFDPSKIENRTVFKTTVNNVTFSFAYKF